MRLVRALSYLFCYFILSTKCFANSPVEVRILADDDYPPYSYVENGVLKGIYIDYLKRLSHHLQDDYTISVMPLPWKRALKLIESGEEFALIPPYIHHKSRPFIAHYSSSIGIEKVVVFCHKDVSLEHAFSLGPKARPALKLGINAGYLLLNDKYKSAVSKRRIILATNKSTASNVEKLIKRRIDCYINDETSTLITLSDVLSHYHTQFKRDFVVKEVISSQSAHIGYARDFQKHGFSNQAFIDAMNDAINTISPNGINF
ncbi:substrate-binding periplasmic protein [Pseudoalteromonas sp. SSM20]|uniref:substrate-binding periplasmic protein n=1 Tax=Pseudoalteromonas sp. SSM20 TaxID=3139394 RepID=UPI003BA8F687